MHANAPAVALYERAESALPRAPLVHRPLTDPALSDALAAAARTLGYQMS
jgi:hypothetical protein